ncbi:MarR family transcriptional regulator [Sphingomonas sp. H39-1-10]|uniref:MarR family transcriptional regulator n=1 Tax=Sphingomonas pollutisoli TaxID=3030829 RepID=UPI0023B9B405|nr:MarR family transcriptional regulator [Sphingomonas pollutisoli]MDF0491169.1 MarR family transcriptional regulator [Sphingomonas pollutisoli]
MMYDGKMSRRVEMARLLVSQRTIVGDVLDVSVCPNPILDMLLDLYLARHEHREVYLWPLCIAAHCPLSTGHRKVRFMEKRGFVIRGNPGRDRRRANVLMTDQGAELMDTILDRMTTRVFDTCAAQQI